MLLSKPGRQEVNVAVGWRLFSDRLVENLKRSGYNIVGDEPEE